MTQPMIRVGALLLWLAGGIGAAKAQTGSISGVVHGINFNTVEVYSESGGFVARVTQDNQEAYQIGGLPAGNYYVIADSLFTTHVTQLHAGVACPLFACLPDLSGGTLVPVAAGQDSPGIDFQLNQGGGLTIRVATEGAGDLISGARVYVYDATGTELAVADGSMVSLSGLVPGTYFAIAEDPGGAYDRELFDNHPCAACAPTTGTPITVNQAEYSGGMIRLVDSHLGFFTLPPCRLVDTRQSSTPLRGGDPFRRYDDFSVCAVPLAAVALTVNVTAVNATAGGGICVRAGGADNHYTTPALFPTVQFRTGITRANNAIVSVARGPGDDVGFLALPFISTNETVDLLVDVTGYFAPVP